MNKREFIKGFKEAYGDGNNKLNCIKFLKWHAGCDELGLKGCVEAYDKAMKLPGDVVENMYAEVKPYVLVHKRGFLRTVENKCLYECTRCLASGYLNNGKGEVIKPPCDKEECLGTLVGHVEIVTTIRRIKKEEV